jgi:soluble lytic murein transglycosylase
MAAASMQQSTARTADPLAPLASAQVSQVTQSSPAGVYDVNYALADWRRLRASDGYSFADYARFVIANPGWPSEASIRRSAERAMRPGENANVVIAFFRSTEPQSGNGWARLAEANLTLGRPTEALAAAKGAWLSSDLSQYDEQSIFARFGSQLTAQDHDRRVDALLFDKKYSDAYRMMAWATPSRKAAFQARIAMQSRMGDAEQRYQAVIGQVTSDAGLMMDRARYLRDSGYEQAARDLFARQHSFTYKPAKPERFLDMMAILTKAAAGDRQWQTAYNIGNQVDDLFSPGVDISLKNYAIRDSYTTVVWTAGTVALERMNRGRDAIGMFD